MKKILFGLVCLVLLTSTVYADGFNLTLTGDSEFSNEITLTLNVSELSGFPSGLYGLSATLNYDANKIELVSIEGVGNFDVVYDISKSNTFVTYRDTGIAEGNDIVTFKFRNVSLEVGETATISFSNVVASTGEEDVNGTIASKTITLAEPDYMLGDFNSNSRIDLQDVILALKYYLGSLEITPSVIQIGDIDQNGVIGLKDVISILRLYLDN